MIFCVLFFRLLIILKINFFKNSIRNTIRVSNSSDPDLVPNCLQSLTADDTSMQRIKSIALKTATDGI